MNATARLDVDEARRRAARLRVLLTDVDGVLTDAGVYYSARGEELKRFSIRDGMGVQRLREGGVATGIVTGERSAAVAARAQKLRVELLFEGVGDKGAALPDVLLRAGCTAAQAAYIGDDVNDLAVIAAVGVEGITAAPADAVPEVARAVHYVCAARGGEGAFREFADWLLALRAG